MTIVFLLAAFFCNIFGNSWLTTFCPPRFQGTKRPLAVNSAPAPGPLKTKGVVSGKRCETTLTSSGLTETPHVVTEIHMEVAGR